MNSFGTIDLYKCDFFYSAKTGTTDSKIKTFLKGLKCRKSNDELFT